MSHPLFDCSGRIAVVTGGGGHIGGATARALAQAGADVAIVDLRPGPAEQVAQQVRAFGRRAHVVVSDASDDAAVQASATEIEEALGPIDILVNVAGASEPRPFQDLVPADFLRMFQANVASAWSWSHRVVPGMIERKHGRIVNMSSISGKHGGGPPASVSRSAYASAKAGVIGLTKGLARELAPYVTVNCVCPGLIRTDRTSGIIDGPHKDVVTGMIPMGRPGEPEEVAAAILYLVSPGAAWVTGTSLDVNGGQWMS